MSDRLPERIVDIAASLEVACARLSQNTGWGILEMWRRSQHSLRLCLIK